MWQCNASNEKLRIVIRQTHTLATSILIMLLLTIPSTAQTQEEEDSNLERAELPASYTQEDFSILVGNVQRPNGIVYLNDMLYTACNGDWTLYEVDSVTGATETFVFGVEDSHTLYAEESETGFNLWIPDFPKNQLILIDETRSTPAVITDELEGPWGIIYLDDERFLISNLLANNIVITSREGEVQELVEGLRSPTGIARQGNRIFVANNGSARRAIEWFEYVESTEDAEEEGLPDITLNPLVSGLQNVSNLVMAEDGYLYFTYALGTRGVVGRIWPDDCVEEGCVGEDVEIVVFTDLPAPLSGLTISPDLRLFVHAIYRPEIYWLSLYD